jgi:hypothetical protein
MTNEDGFWKEGPSEDLVQTSFEKNEGLVKTCLREGVKFQNLQNVGCWSNNLSENNNLNVQITISFWQWKCKTHVFFVCMTVNGNFFMKYLWIFYFKKLIPLYDFPPQYLGKK